MNERSEIVAGSTEPSDCPRTRALLKEIEGLGYSAANDRCTSLCWELEKENARLKVRYTWSANELLACDYGDNDAAGEQVGWHVYGWRDRSGKRRIYGPSIDQAIDAELAK